MNMIRSACHPLGQILTAPRLGRLHGHPPLPQTSLDWFLGPVKTPFDSMLGSNLYRNTYMTSRPLSLTEGA